MIEIIYTNCVHTAPYLRKLLWDPDLTVRFVIYLESHGLDPSSPVALWNSPFSP